MIWASVSKFSDICFERCKSTEISFFLYILEMLERQCIGIFVSFLYTWVSYIPLLINNLESRNFEWLFSTVALYFFWYFQSFKKVIFFGNFPSIAYIIYMLSIKYRTKWLYDISFHFCHVNITKCYWKRTTYGTTMCLKSFY